MRIGMILDDKFPPDPRVENEALALIKDGHEVFLFCLHYGTDSFVREEVYKKIIVKRYSISQFTYKLSALAYTVPFYHWIMSTKIQDFISKFGLSVLHVHDIQIARSVFLLKKRNNLKIILDLHENRPEIMKFYRHVKTFPGQLLISAKRWKSFEKKYIKKSDYTIVVTPEARDYYLKNSLKQRKDFIVTPNTVREEFYKDLKIDNEIIQRYESNFVLLYVGDTGIRRGLDTVLSAVPQLIEKIPELKIVIVGKNNEDQYLRKMVDSLSIKSHVDIEGWKNFSLFQSYISASSICLSPLHRNIHHDTTFANKLFQYMSLGKSVIVSDCPAQAAVVQKKQCGEVFTASDTDNFSRKVFKLYSKTDLRKVYEQNAIKAVTNEYNWEMTSKELLNLYQNL